jgi:hypothetical protein
MKKDATITIVYGGGDEVEWKVAEDDAMSAEEALVGMFGEYVGSRWI